VTSTTVNGSWAGPLVVVSVVRVRFSTYTRGAATVIVLGPPAESSARLGTIEVAVGPAWISGATVRAADANETRPEGGTFRLFSTSTTLGSRTGIEGRLGVRLTENVEAQGAVSYATPELRVALSNDVESAAPVTATERIQQFGFSGGALWYPPYRRAHARFIPFLSGELGYLRSLHEGGMLVETGALYQVGGGMKLMLRAGTGRLKAVGVRLDGRAVFRPKGIVFDAVHVSPAIGASLYARF